MFCEVLTVRREDKNQILSTLGLVGNLGFTMVATIAAGLFLGHMADAWLSTSPWCSVVGIVLGMITGMWAMYKKATGK
jgi:F0F1-type ATP synthase assembly protein I